MKKLFLIVVAAVLVGCHTTDCNRGPRVRQPAAKPVAQPAPKPVVQSVSKVTAKQMPQCLRVRVKGAADEKSAADRKLDELLRPNVQKALRAAGFDVVDSGEAEMEVVASARCILPAAVRGSRIVCRGAAELKFTRKLLRNPVTGKENRSVVDTRRFDAKSGEARTEEEALMSLADNLSVPLAKWLGECCASMAADLALCSVSVLPADTRHAIPADYPTRFVKEVLAIPGVYDCRIVPQGASGTSFNVNVLYDTRQVPDGIVSRLASVKSLGVGK